MRGEDQAQRMTIDEFLRWDDGTATRYELDDGITYAMATPRRDHGTVVSNLAGAIRDAVRQRPPCRAITDGGIKIDGARYFAPDVLMTCEKSDDSTWYEAPQIIVEVTSTSATGIDKDYKLPFYLSYPSIREVWYVDSRRRFVQIWYRREDHWDGSAILIGKASFRSEVLGQDIPLEEVYRLTSL